MCIIIDANALSSVFNSQASDHHEFKPVADWIIHGKGKVVWGGTKYRCELTAAGRYLSLLIELMKQEKVVVACLASVDQEQQRIEQLVGDESFNDAHLAAIVAVSGCRLVCSKDSSADRFLKCREIYPDHIDKPKIYRRLSHRHLLCDASLAPCCR